MTKRRKLIVANWKMNGRISTGVRLASDLADKMLNNRLGASDMVLCPPATLLWPIAEVLAGSHIHLGGQDCHTANHGAYTGSISAGMLVDVGCRYVIVGHSERRKEYGESNALIAQKVTAAQQAGLTAILCVGEDREIRMAGKAEEFVADQLRASLPEKFQPSSLVVAYEPVWAIGTGDTPDPQDIDKMHRALRKSLGAMGEVVQILYGGSVTPQVAGQILFLSEVDGALVGSASLNADGFWAIAEKAG